MGSPSLSPCHGPESHAQLCLSTQTLMHVPNEDVHLTCIKGAGRPKLHPNHQSPFDNISLMVINL